MPQKDAAISSKVLSKLEIALSIISESSFSQLVNLHYLQVLLVMRRDGSKDLKDLQGMRFKKDGYTFKASQIRRGLSYAVILPKLNANEEKEQQRTINSQSRQIQTEQPRQETYSEQQKHNEPSIGIPSLEFFDTTNPVYDPAEEEFRRRMQKKKKRRGPKL
ncbi:MAG: hypothetical protein K6D37_03280 [Prevotella sp.]|nr:hypothetical protein [Prevotella sp.]